MAGSTELRLFRLLILLMDMVEAADFVRCKGGRVTAGPTLSGPGDMIVDSSSLQRIMRRFSAGLGEAGSRSSIVR